jgi:hypothetical protein
MSGAQCQACVVKVAALPVPVGTVSEPFGVCNNCQCLTCGHHGHRDTNVPECMCVQCDKTLLVASAAMASTTTSGTTGGQGSAAQTLTAPYHLSTLPTDIWRVHNLADFQRRRPGYGEEFFARVRRSSIRVGTLHEHPALREAFAEPTNETQQLLIAASLISRDFRSREERRPETLPEHLQVLDTAIHVTW